MSPQAFRDGWTQPDPPPEAGARPKGRNTERRIRMPLRARYATLKTNGLRGLIIAAVIGLLAWSWRDLSLTAVGTVIARWGWHEGLLFGVLNLFILAAMCWRWSFILHQLQFPVPFGSLILYRMGANTLSYVTPGPQFGGEPLQVYCLTAL